MTVDRAPVALFIYNRPEHTARTLAALAANDGAAETDLIVYADGAKSTADAPAVEAARAVARAAEGFRSVEMVERSANLGLAASIAGGVGEVMDRAGRAIVVEDDVETARGFLDYMNAALDRYRDEPRVWHVSGWTAAIDPSGLPPFFFWPVMNCWGWATWADRWTHYAREPERLMAWPAAQRRAFDLDGAGDFFAQAEANAAGRITTWAVFWYATIFERDGLCLNPAESFVRNTGHDGSGVHSGAGGLDQPFDPARRFDGGLPDAVAPDPEAIARIRAHLARPLHRRIARQVRTVVGRLRA